MPTILYKSSAGKRLPGTTYVIGSNLGWNKDALKHWAWKQGMDGLDYRVTTKKACDAGTIAHYLIECNLKKIKPDLEPYQKMPDLLAEATFAYEQNFLPWKKMVKFTVVATEIHLISEIFGYGATPDCIAKVNRRLAVFDWKTSNGLYPEMILQMASYEHAWNENNPDDPIEDGAYMLRIDKETASFHFHHWQDLSKPWEVFKHLLGIHAMKNAVKRMT